MDSADLPRWRGFNLQVKYSYDTDDVDRWVDSFREEDFRWIAEWGFDFVRVPLDYRYFAGDGGGTGGFALDDLDEDELEDVDEGVAYAREYDVHLQLNFHKAPGYTVNDDDLDGVELWTDERAQDDFVEHWRRFAERYRGVPSERLSFNLVNEPSGVSHGTYAALVRRAVDAIHEVDPERLVIADGAHYGSEPVFGLADVDCAQSTRGYSPMPVSHYGADWIDYELPEPDWPMVGRGGRHVDADSLYAARIAPWEHLAERGVGVHVGEWGAYNRTDHDVALDWMEDCLRLWERAGWGWALWNFRGPFGILDSGRDDVDYEDWHGHDLDREMLDLLQAY